MKGETVVAAFLSLIDSQTDKPGNMPKFVVAAANGNLDVLSVYTVDGNIVIDVEEPDEVSSPPAVGMLLLTFDAKKAVSYKDILRV